MDSVSRKTPTEAPSTSLTNSADTTRTARLGEKEGVAYYFTTKEPFEKKIAEGGFIEYATFSGYFYGTSHDAVTRAGCGEDVYLDIEMVKV
jgi:guanylate kinase